MEVINANEPTQDHAKSADATKKTTAETDVYEQAVAWDDEHIEEGTLQI